MGTAKGQAKFRSGLNLTRYCLAIAWLWAQGFARRASAGCWISHPSDVSWTESGKERKRDSGGASTDRKTTVYIAWRNVGVGIGEGVWKWGCAFNCTLMLSTCSQGIDGSFNPAPFIASRLIQNLVHYVALAASA